MFLILPMRHKNCVYAKKLQTREELENIISDKIADWSRNVGFCNKSDFENRIVEAIYTTLFYAINYKNRNSMN